MAEQHPGLNERQHMILSHLVSGCLKEAGALRKAVENPKAALQSLGASEADVAAIQAHVKSLGDSLKKNNVGFW